MRRLCILCSFVVVTVACTAETITSNAAPGSGGATDGTDAAGPDRQEGEENGSGAPRDGGKEGGDSKSDGGGCTSKRWYEDKDRDGFGLASSFKDSCTQPSGYAADKTDCDDGKAAVKPGAVEHCDAIDSNCDGQVNGTAAEATACTAAAGSYAGTFTIYTAEKVGSTIVNQVTCTGTTAQTIDLTRGIVVQGTTTCSYAGSLGGFSKTQTGTIEGAFRLDGTFEGKLMHTFGSGVTRTFTIGGTVEDARIDVSSKGSWYPNRMAAVPWEVTITIGASKS